MKAINNININHKRRGDAGFSLTEILVTIGILSIMGTIATVTYSKYDLGVEKRNLRQAGRYFALAVGNCVRANGGWDIKRPGYDTVTGKHSMTAKTIYPCNANKQELKDKLDFECPANSTCEINSRSWDPGPGDRVYYYCLSIKKEVQGKELQVLVTVPKNNVSYYKVFCKEGFLTGSFENLNGLCRGASDLNKIIDNHKTAGFSKLCDWGLKQS